MVDRLDAAKVFMVQHSWGGSVWLMSVWAGVGLYEYYLVGGYCYGDRVWGCGCRIT